MYSLGQLLSVKGQPGPVQIKAADVNRDHKVELKSFGWKRYSFTVTNPLSPLKYKYRRFAAQL